MSSSKDTHTCGDGQGAKSRDEEMPGLEVLSWQVGAQRLLGGDNGQSEICRQDRIVPADVSRSPPTGALKKYRKVQTRGVVPANFVPGAQSRRVSGETQCGNQ